MKFEDKIVRMFRLMAWTWYNVLQKSFTQTILTKYDYFVHQWHDDLVWEHLVMRKLAYTYTYIWLFWHTATHRGDQTFVLSGVKLMDLKSQFFVLFHLQGRFWIYFHWRIHVSIQAVVNHSCLINPDPPPPQGPRDGSRESIHWTCQAMQKVSHYCGPGLRFGTE